MGANDSSVFVALICGLSCIIQFGSYQLFVLFLFFFSQIQSTNTY